jgi:hypothetical protein
MASQLCPAPVRVINAIGLAKLTVAYAMAKSAKYVDICPPRCEGGYSPKEAKMVMENT